MREEHGLGWSSKDMFIIVEEAFNLLFCPYQYRIIAGATVLVLVIMVMDNS